MKRAILCAALCVLLGGCGARGTIGPDITDPAQPDAVISADLIDFPQDLRVYAAGQPELALLSEEKQKEEDARFNRLFFQPWGAKAPSSPAEQVFEAVRGINPLRVYVENLRPVDPERWQAILANTDEAAFAGKNGTALPAITVKTAYLRRLPTAMPFFLYPRQAGEGFPFDYLQNSALWAGTPVSIIHRSRDSAWVYVESALVGGWVSADSVAVAGPEFMEYWRSLPLAAVLRDNVQLADGNAGRDAATGKPLPVTVHIGTVLPMDPASGSRSSPVLLFPARGNDGMAVIRRARVAPEDAAPKPLPLTPYIIASVGNGMMGQPYGWGGLFENRDCSSTMRDLFTPFGIWLPRNSQAQGRMGRQVTVTSLNPDEKERVIMAEGVPFFSLVRMRGHVGLYLGSYAPRSGQYQGREMPVFFHNIWGLRVLDPERADESGNPLSGRAVIGKAVVTTLRPGAEHPDISSPASLLDRIDGLAVLPQGNGQ